MSEPIWNRFLTEQDKAVFAASGYGARQDFGKRPLHHLEHYRESWNERLGVWPDQPLKNGHQHAADALRQHAQVFQAPAAPRRHKRRHRPNAMAVQQLKARTGGGAN